MTRGEIHMAVKIICAAVVLLVGACTFLYFRFKNYGRDGRTN